jgi:hypothetical protein
LLGALQQPGQTLSDPDLTRGKPRSGDPGALREVAIQILAKPVDVCTHLTEHPRHETVVLSQESVEEMLAVDLGVAQSRREGLAFSQGLLGLLGESIQIHTTSWSRLVVLRRWLAILGRGAIWRSGKPAD